MHGFVLAVIQEPWFRLGVMSFDSRGLAPLWAPGCGAVAWIRAGSNPGALVPSWGNVYRFPRARAPLGRDGAWLRGFVIAVIRAPMHPID